MIYLELFWGFLKVGMFAFGGAYAAIPLIRDIVLSYGWLNDDKLSYMIAVSESTPGPIMVNLATYGDLCGQQSGRPSGCSSRDDRSSTAVLYSDPAGDGGHEKCHKK